MLLELLNRRNQNKTYICSNSANKNICLIFINLSLAYFLLSNVSKLSNAFPVPSATQDIAS